MKVNGQQKPSNGSSAATAVFEHPEEAHPRRAERRAGPRRADDSGRLQALLDESNANALAMGNVVAALQASTSADEAMRAALDTVREAFGWAYGSYWHLDSKENAP